MTNRHTIRVLLAAGLVLVVVPTAAADAPTDPTDVGPWTAMDWTTDQEFNPIPRPWIIAQQDGPPVTGQRLAPVTTPSAPTARRAPKSAPSSTSSAPRRAPRAVPRVAGPRRTTAPRPARRTVRHVVRPGQTLTSIGRHYGVAPLAIAADNDVANPDFILAWSTLTIRDRS